MVLVDPTGLGIFGDILDVIEQIIEDILGTSSPAKAARGPIDVTARALECAPDVIRIKIAIDFRRNTVLDPDLDLNDALDKFDKGRNRRLKPGKGPAG